jgi:hypothetical protein
MHPKKDQEKWIAFRGQQKNAWKSLQCIEEYYVHAAKHKFVQVGVKHSKACWASCGLTVLTNPTERKESEHPKTGQLNLNSEMPLNCTAAYTSLSVADIRQTFTSVHCAFLTRVSSEPKIIAETRAFRVYATSNFWWDPCKIPTPLSNLCRLRFGPGPN